MNIEKVNHITLDMIYNSDDERAEEGVKLSDCTPSMKALEEIRQAKKKLDHYHNNLEEYTNLTTTQRGNILEDFIELIFKNIKIFKYERNHLTSTNEIDFYVQLNQKGRLAKGINYGSLIPEWFPDDFTFECKNYTTKITVTQINKFHSTLDIGNSSLGVFFGYHPLTGEDKQKVWSAAFGLISKIALINNHINSKPIIIYGKKESYNELDRENYDILEWIVSKKLSLSKDVRNAFTENEAD